MENANANNITVAIVIPLSYDNNFNESEKISLRHLEYCLGNYHRYFIVPRGVHFSYKDYEVLNFPAIYFGSTQAHSRLLLSKTIYQAFHNYDYVFIYHLDSLVFTDKLLYWCEQGYDFIGAPWIIGPDLPWLKISRVGNGGFSLRKVDSFMKVLNSSVRWKDHDKYWQSILRQFKGPKRYVRVFKRLLLEISYRNTVTSHINKHLETQYNEDRFWSRYANHYYPEFKIAPIEKALQFAFEANIKESYRMNNYKLPFGCHAWEKYDKSFWEPYLLTKNKYIYL
jgi:hypothetical protein